MTGIYATWLPPPHKCIYHHPTPSCSLICFTRKIDLHVHLHTIFGHMEMMKLKRLKFVCYWDMWPRRYCHVIIFMYVMAIINVFKNLFTVGIVCTTWSMYMVDVDIFQMAGRPWWSPRIDLLWRKVSTSVQVWTQIPIWISTSTYLIYW